MPIQSLTTMQHKELVAQALEFATKLQEQVQDSISARERRFYYKMQHIIENPEYKALFIELLDSSVHTKDMAHNFELIKRILSRYEFGEFFTSYEKVLLFVFLQVGRYAPSLSVPLFIQQIRKDSSLMLAFGTPESNANSATYYFIAKRALSTAIIQDNIKKCKRALESRHITHISIKPSAFFIWLWGGDYARMQGDLAQSLHELFAYARAQQHSQGVPKVITLDMEEHQFLELSVSAFMEALSGYGEIEAGIALQAYVPESYSYLERLCAYAKDRVDSGGKPVYIRLVKGANMQAQKLYASQHNVALPIFSQKLHTDANYKKMLHYVMDSTRYRFVKLGVASHNVFELAYAYTLIQHCVEPEYREHFVFEMSMGISMQASRILGTYHKLMLYTPVCDDKSFKDTIAYLLRRLDENTSEENFMRNYYAMRVGDESWQKQETMFMESLAYIPQVSSAPICQRDNSSKACLQASIYEMDTEFFTQATYHKFAQALAQDLPQARIQASFGASVENDEQAQIISSFDGQSALGEVVFASAFDEKALLAPYSPVENLSAVFSKAAESLQARRGEIIKLATLESGKVPMETDMELSELITLLRFYPASLRDLCTKHPQVSLQPKGRGLVVGSAHSHLSVVFSAVLASLACGNQVVFKPSSLVVCSSFVVCECLWGAGIGRNVLCFMPMRRDRFQQALAQMPEDFFAFAVGFGQARSMESIALSQPNLLAHTIGFNAMIVTKFADYDQAIAHAVSSAFFYGGVGLRKLSVLIVEQGVFDDESFRQRLLECANSLRYGSPLELDSALGVVLDKKAREKLEKLQGAKLESSSPYMGANIIYTTPDGLQAMGRHLPVLYVIKATDLAHAIELANTMSGDISALESLDEDEWGYFHNNAKASTLLINEPTIHTASAQIISTPIGSLMRKIGARNDILQFARCVQNAPDDNLATSIIEPKFKRLLESGELGEERERILHNALLQAKSYVYYRNAEFNVSHDYALEYGKKHLLSYEAVRAVAYRVSADDSLQDMLGVIIGAQACKAKLIVSFEEINEELEFLRQNLASLGLLAELVQESRDSFLARIHASQMVRYHASPNASDPIYKTAVIHRKPVVYAKPFANGRFELLGYYKERVLSVAHHRYGVFAESKLAKLLG